MRMIEEETLSAFTQEVTTLARLWSVTRSDGIVLGFTDHDGDLEADGIVFRAASALGAQAVERATGLSVDNASVFGALTAAEISEADIAAGRFDGAEIRHWIADWTAPERRVEIFRGTVGEIRRGRTAFEAEVRGASAALNTTVGRVIQRRCDAALGDGRCGVDLSDPGFRAVVTIAEALGDGRFAVHGLSGFEPGWFLHGRMETGAGAASAIREDGIVGGKRVIAPWTPLPLQPGAAVTVIAGCDKRLETCRDRFANLMNFRGFPHVPGEDWLINPPRSDAQNDGGSLFA